MNENRLNAPQRIRQWFENPETPEDAWKTWTLAEIANDAGVSIHSVNMNLPDLVKERYPVIDSYIRFKRARDAYKRINRKPKTNVKLPKEVIEDIRERRRNGDFLVQIALDTGISYPAVQKYCKGIKVKRKKVV